MLLTGLFTGAALASQTGLTLDQFGARPLVGRLVSASMVIELGPVHALQLVIGVLLLLFGLRWLRKVLLRSAGVILTWLAYIVGAVTLIFYAIP